MSGIVANPSGEGDSGVQTQGAGGNHYVGLAVNEGEIQSDRRRCITSLEHHVRIVRSRTRRSAACGDDESKGRQLHVEARCPSHGARGVAHQVPVEQSSGQHEAGRLACT